MFQAKLRKIGNSLGVLIPQEEIIGNEGDMINLEIVEKVESLEIKPEPIIISEPKSTIDFEVPTYCERKHKGNMVFARRCGCY